MVPFGEMHLLSCRNVLIVFDRRCKIARLDYSKNCLRAERFSGSARGRASGSLSTPALSSSSREMSEFTKSEAAREPTSPEAIVIGGSAEV